MATKTPTAKQLLAVAKAEIGVREGRDSNGNWNNRVKYNDWYAAKVKNNGFKTSPWCAIFVSWCANKAGGLGTIIPLHAWTPAGLSWFRSRGLVTQGKGAKVGDIFYVYYPAQRRVAHVGIVEKVDGGYVTTIEGNTNTTGSNQGNGVYRLRRRITDRLYFCHPKYAKAAPSNSGSSSKPSNQKPTSKPKPKLVTKVSVKDLKAARYADPPKQGEPLGAYSDQVFTLETALVRTKWLKPEHADGHYGAATVGDGSRGYGGTTGFQKKHSGTSNPDGWLGRQELTKLFLLAGMRVTVTP